MLEDEYPEIAKDWDYDKNKITPDKVLPFTNKRYYWKCEKGHSYLASPNARCSKVKHAGCSICSGRQLLKGYNDIKTIRPKVAKEWDYNKNKKTPEDYTISSNEKVPNHFGCSMLSLLMKKYGGFVQKDIAITL